MAKNFKYIIRKNPEHPHAAFVCPESAGCSSEQQQRCARNVIEMLNKVDSHNQFVSDEANRSRTALGDGYAPDELRARLISHIDRIQERYVGPEVVCNGPGRFGNCTATLNFPER